MCSLKSTFNHPDLCVGKLESCHGRWIVIILMFNYSNLLMDKLESCDGSWLVTSRCWMIWSNLPRTEAFSCGVMGSGGMIFSLMHVGSLLYWPRVSTSTAWGRQKLGRLKSERWKKIVQHRVPVNETTVISARHQTFVTENCPTDNHLMWSFYLNAYFTQSYLERYMQNLAMNLHHNQCKYFLCKLENKDYWRNAW